jgi:hypothetical protein
MAKRDMLQLCTQNSLPLRRKWKSHAQPGLTVAKRFRLFQRKPPLWVGLEVIVVYETHVALH